MKKVFFINRIYSSKDGATGRLIEELSTVLQSNDFNIQYLCPQKKYNRFLTLMILIYKSLFISKKNCDCVVIMTDPPFLICLAPIFKLKGIKVIHWIQDLYPDLFTINNLSFLNSPIFTKINSFFYKSVDYFIVIGRDIKKHIHNKYHIKEEKISTIYNWANIYLRSLDKIHDDKFRVLYSGNLGNAYNFDLVLSVANLLRNNPNIVFQINGNGCKQNYIFEQINKLNLTNIIHSNYLSEIDYLKSLNESSITLLPIKKITLGQLSPCKIYDSLVCGTPCIYSGPEESEVALLINEYDCGWNIKSAEDIAKKIEELYSNRSEIETKGENALKVNETIGLHKAKKDFEGVLGECITNN